MPEGELPETLCKLLAKAASDLAQQFLSICIRAIDYCPPVAMTFGDYLRAMITADFDLVPSDPWGYREALVDAFIKRQIHIENVDTLSESSLLWPPLMQELGAEIIQSLEPEPDEFSRRAYEAENKYQLRAQRVITYLNQIDIHRVLGFTSENDCDAAGPAGPIVVESARVSRRVGPDGQIALDLVAEVTQTIPVRLNDRVIDCTQGCTIIIDANGRVRYVVQKNVKQILRGLNPDNLQNSKSWKLCGDKWCVRENLFHIVHDEKSHTSDTNPTAS
jgi:hypothetical protein